MILLATTHPVAILSSAIAKSPINIDIGDQPVLLIRDEAGAVKAFDRHLEPDLIAHFTLNTNPKRHGALVDVDTNTGWNRAGVAVDGDKTRIGRKLSPINLQEEVYWGVAKYWMPDLQLLKPKAADAPAAPQASIPEPAPTPHTARYTRSHRRSKP